MTFIDILVASVLFMIMFGIGISLTFQDLKLIIKSPKGFIISLFSQMIFLPTIAFGIAFSTEIDSYIKIGLIILAASPGGTTSGFISYLFKGNVALSVVLTATNSLLTMFSIPLIVNFAIGKFEGNYVKLCLPFVNTLCEILILTVVPIVFGLIFKKIANHAANKIAKILKPVMIILLGFVFLIKIFGSDGKNGIKIDEIFAILPYALLLNILCLTTGFLVSKLFSLHVRDNITISVESGVHNTTLAFLISGTLLANDNYGKVAIVYAMFSFWTAIVFCLMIKKKQVISYFRLKLNARIIILLKLNFYFF